MKNEKNQQKLSILEYSVIGASSEDREHPLYSIISDNKNEGWSSLRFCSFPQEIIIQLNKPARLSQINLTLHETKIPSKIDFFYFFPEKKSDFNIKVNNIPFIKLGFIIPDTNEKTNFKTREYKKIQINKNVYYIKFILHKNFLNLHNKCNQVGLVNIQCLGIDFNSNNINEFCKGLDKNLYLENQQKLIFEDKKYDDNNLDTTCLNKLKEIKNVLDLCIKEQKYDKAKIYNELYRRVRALGEKIKKLTDCKIKCIETSQFDSCKKLQYDIDRIKETINGINIYYDGVNDNQ